MDLRLEVFSLSTHTTFGQLDDMASTYWGLMKDETALFFIGKDKEPINVSDLRETS